MQRGRTWHGGGALLTLALLVSACGTTVPLTSPGAPSSGAVSPGQVDPLGGTAGGTAGSSATGGGAVSSDSGTGGTGTAGSGATGTSTVAGGGGTGGTGTGSTGTPGPIGGNTVRAPLKVGITYIDNDTTSSQLGVSSDATVNGRTTSQALVRGFNASGGLAGRRIVPVEYRWNSGQSGSWSQDATAACQRFTRDDRVDVVADGAFGTTGGFGECLQKAGVLQISRGPDGDRQASHAASLHANTGSMVYERVYTSVLQELVATGYLGRTNQLGIVLEQCPTIERAYTRTVAPLIGRLGLKTPLQRTVDCTTSFASAGPAASSISSAVLAFRSGGVDRVMFVSDFEDVALLLFSTNADSQGYQPGYALSSGAQASLFADNVPKSQWPQLHGVGTTPGNDTTNDRTAPTGVEARCLKLARAGGLRPANATDRSFVYNACGLLLLLESALTRTHGVSSPRALQAGINGLGRSFAAPGLVGGRTRYSSRDHDGPDAVRVFAFVAGCTCMRYTGPLRPAPA